MKRWTRPMLAAILMSTLLLSACSLRYHIQHDPGTAEPAGEPPPAETPGDPDLTGEASRPEPLPEPPLETDPAPEPQAEPEPNPAPKPEPDPEPAAVSGDELIEAVPVAPPPIENSGPDPDPDTPVSNELTTNVAWEGVVSPPENIRGMLASRQLLYSEGVHLLPAADETGAYVLVAAGERPTGGYSVEVQRVVQRTGRAEVYYRVIAPPPDAMVTQAFTYPYALIRLEEPAEEVVGVRADDAPAPLRPLKGGRHR